MIIRVLVLLIVVAALEFMGCSTPGASSRGSSDQTEGATLFHNVQSLAQEIHSVRAYGSAHVVSSGAAYNAEVEVSLRAPDSLRVKITGPFGVLLGIIFATRHAYVAYNAWENSVTRGILAPNVPLPFAGFPFSVDDAMQFLRGLPPEADSATITIASANCIEASDAHGRYFKCELESNGERKAVIRDSAGGQVFEYFRDFRMVNGVRFPYHIAATLPDRGSVKIDFDEITLNTTALDFSIPVPASAHPSGGK